MRRTSQCQSRPSKPERSTKKHKASECLPVTEISNIKIREIEEIAEMRVVEELQKEVWGIPDLDVVPYTHLVAAKEAGGVLIGAFDGETHGGVCVWISKFRTRTVGPSFTHAGRETCLSQFRSGTEVETCAARTRDRAGN